MWIVFKLQQSSCCKWCNLHKPRLHCHDLCLGLQCRILHQWGHMCDMQLWDLQLCWGYCVHPLHQQPWGLWGLQWSGDQNHKLSGELQQESIFDWGSLPALHSGRHVQRGGDFNSAQCKCERGHHRCHLHQCGIIVVTLATQGITLCQLHTVLAS